MTRKDYQVIAGTIETLVKGLKFNLDYSDEKGLYSLAVMRELVNNLSDKLQAENPRFNRDIFWKACGLEVR